MTPALVILDCDGVLVDSEPVSCAVEAELLSALGYHLTPEESARRFLGRPAAEMVREVEAALGRALPADFETTLERRIAAAYPGTLTAVPGAAELLRDLAVPRCVASSASPTKLFAGLVETDLLDRLYPHVFSTVLVERGKPAPDLFLFAAGRMGAPPARCVVVEDSVAGVRAGKAAGMAVIGFCGGSHCPPDHAATLAAAGADATVSRHDAVLRAIAAL